MNERELFETEMKSKCIIDLDFVKYHESSNKYVIQSGLSGDDFRVALDASHVVNVAWLMWQSSVNREGYKLVPLDTTT